VGAAEGGGALDAAAVGASTAGALVFGSSQAQPSTHSITQVHVVRVFIGSRA
jgi:hypothetical protein